MPCFLLPAKHSKKNCNSMGTSAEYKKSKKTPTLGNKQNGAYFKKSGANPASSPPHLCWNFLFDLFDHKFQLCHGWPWAVWSIHTVSEVQQGSTQHPALNILNKCSVDVWPHVFLCVQQKAFNWKDFWQQTIAWRVPSFENQLAFSGLNLMAFACNVDWIGTFEIGNKHDFNVPF